MNYFLIDYENVNISGLEGVSNLTADDVVIVFYSNNANTLTFELHRKINESKAEFQFQKVDCTEKNALDFQLCSYLGFLIRDKLNEAGNIYYIVSNDKGYKVLIDYWKKKSIEIKMVINVAKGEIIEQQPTISQSEVKVNVNDELKQKLKTVLKTETEISEAIQIINQCKTKCSTNNELNIKFKTYGNGVVYKAIKDVIKDKQGN